MAKGKVYVWIGDDGDNQSVSIERKVYSKDSKIPADRVAPDVLAVWIERGLVSEDGQRIVVSAEATELEAENKALKSALEKAKSGKKATAVKELEKNAIAQSERIKELEAIGLERLAAAKAAEADIEEKAALIEKHAARITELESEVEALTEPKTGDANTDGGGDAAGPGGR